MSRAPRPHAWIPWASPDFRSAFHSSSALLAATITSNPSSPGIPGPANHRVQAALEPAHREMIIRHELERLVEKRLKRLEGPRALNGDHRGVEGPIHEIALCAVSQLRRAWL